MHSAKVGSDERIMVVGAGPCGLGCGRELERLGHSNWLILERAQKAGGLATSVLDPQGFTWDMGGHVVFSHYGEFDALVDETMGEELLRHERSSFVRFGDRWVPYPFQNNLRRLPEPILGECLRGLKDAPGGNPSMDFATWMKAVFGEGITKHFMRPYNFKVWATPPERMASHWIAERVSVVDYERVAANVARGIDDVAWGPNNMFVFPAVGGTGEIYRRLALRLGERVNYGREVVGIEPLQRLAHLSDGSHETYDALVSTIPLDQLISMIPSSPPQVREAAGALEHNSVYMVGIGYRTPLDDDKSWMYFPDSEVPFYRATNFAKYSPAHVPGSDTSTYCSYMTETSFSSYKSEPRDGLEERIEAGLRSAAVVEGRPEIASMHCESIPYAYPVPTLDRDRALAVIQPWLEEQRIYSRGRFGSWRYEVGNMDHSTKMGIDVARRLIRDQPEEVA